MLLVSGLKFLLLPDFSLNRFGTRYLGQALKFPIATEFKKRTNVVLTQLDSNLGQ